VRIVRQLLTESLLLATTGGAVGLLLGMSALSVFKAVLPASTPGLAEAAIDWRIAGGVAVLALATGLVFGIAPALGASRLDPAASIKSGGQRSSGVLWTRLRGGLISAQIALAVVLVVGAGLLIRSLYALAETAPGFQPSGILTLRISPNQSECRQRAACIAFYDGILDRVRALPGVAGAAVANSVPLDGTLPVLAVDVEDHPKTAERPAPLFWLGAVSPDYLRLMQVPLLAGRGFSDADGPEAERVVLISARTAQRYWPGQDAIGKHVRSAGESGWRRVVGVVGDVRQFHLSQDLPDSVPGAMYMPYAQAVRDDGQIPAAMNLLIRADAPSARIERDVLALARAQGPEIPVSPLRSLGAIVAGSIADFRATIRVFVSFAGVALGLAAIGIYGLLSHWVAQRTYEIGVRSALGATKRRIAWMIVSEGLRLTGYGTAVGAVAALGLTRFLSGLLHGVQPHDPLTLVSVIAFVFTVAACAAVPPAWRAAGIDPIRALRVD
jgi:predicted permease